MCHVSGTGEERSNCVVCHFWTIVDLLFEGWAKGRNCWRGNPFIGIAGWKLAWLCNQTSAILKTVFDVSGERRGAARLVLGNSISFSYLALLVQSSYIPVTSYSVCVIICKVTSSWVTASETYFKLVVSLAAPKRHQLNVQTIFFSFAELMHWTSL